MIQLRAGRRHDGFSLTTRAGLAACAVLVSFAIVLTGASAAFAGDGSAAYGGAGLVEVRSARILTRGVLALSFSGRYFESTDISQRLAAGVGRYGSLHVASSYGVLPWLEVSFDVPLRGAAWDADGGNIDVRGLSNPSLGVKLGVPSRESVFSAALWGDIGLPIASEMTVADTAGGSVLLAGGAQVDATAALLLTADLTNTFPVRFHANIGWRFNREDERGRRFFPDSYPQLAEGGSSTDNDFLLLRGAVEFPGRSIDLFTEFRADIFADSDVVARKENPVMITPGLRFRVGEGWSVTSAISVALSGDDAATPDFDPHDAWPDWVATVAVSYAWPVTSTDTDGDGIPDYRDSCPNQPEDMDGFEDDDGCPDFDDDADGIPDLIDLAPLTSEDYDGFQDEDGVPDLDNDGDGITDERDMCPDEREDLDGFEDEDGCPDD